MSLEVQAANVSHRWLRIARRIRVPLGFGVAAATLWLAQPTLSMIVAGSLMATAGLAVRALASGQLRKNEELATTGPYSYTRNPLYLGSILIGIGFALAARNVWIWILLAVMFAIIYLPVIRSEELFLRSRFPDFELYARRVPRLAPRWSGESVISSFSLALYLKHREYNAVIGAVLMMLALAVKLLTVKNAGA